MKNADFLLDKFIAASCRINAPVISTHSGIQICPHVNTAIFTAKKMLPLIEDSAIKNRVINILHDIYKELKTDIKNRGALVNGHKHPALDCSLQAYRIIIS